MESLRVLLFLLGLVALALPVSTQETTMDSSLCPDSYYEVGDRCLLVNPFLEGTWVEARYYCHTLGSEFVEIDTFQFFPDLLNFLRNQSLDQHSYWLGARDEEVEGEWRWELGGGILPLGSPFWALRYYSGDTYNIQYASQLGRREISAQPFKKPQKPAGMSHNPTIKKRATPLAFGLTTAPTPAPTQKPIKKMKKQRAAVAPDNDPAPPQDKAVIQPTPKDQPSSARKSPEDESPSGSNDCEEPPSAMDGPEIQPPPARAPDQHEEDSASDDPLAQLSQGTSKGSCRSKPRRNFQLTPEQEDNLLEWLRENELLWRRGHMQFKDVHKKRGLWEKKAQEFGLTTEHLQGWWRGMQTWFVKLHKVKSGQARKKLTDREMYVLQKFSFYEGQLRHRSTAPLKPLPRGVEADALGQLSDVGDLDAGDGPAGEGPAGDGAADADLPTDRYLDQDQFLSQLERGDVKKLKTPKCPAGGSKRRTATEEEDVLKDIRDSMKVSTELLSQLVHKSDQGPREPFITYLSETLRTLPEDQYHVVMKHIISLINNLPHPAATFGPHQWQYSQQYPFSQPVNNSQQQYPFQAPTFQQATSTTSLQTTQESTQPQYTRMAPSTSTPSTIPGVASTPISSALAGANDVLNMSLGSVNLSGVADVANSSFKSIGNLNTPRLVSPRGDGEPD